MIRARLQTAPRRDGRADPLPVEPRTVRDPAPRVLSNRGDEKRRTLSTTEPAVCECPYRELRYEYPARCVAQPVGRQFAEFEVLALPSRGVMPLKPGERAKNKLQRLSEVMSRHCKQHFAEFPSAAQVRLTPTADAPSLI